MTAKSCTLYSLVLHVIISFVHGTDTQTWTDRAKQLCALGEICDPPIGSWMPLPEGVKCGVVDCDWPSQWCTISKGIGAGIPDIKCTDVPTKCQQHFGQPDPVQKDSVLVDHQATPPTSGANMPSVAPPGKGGSCIDQHELCCYWAAKGECDKNAFFMKLACQKSCGTCGCTVETAPSCAVKVNIGQCNFLSAMDESNVSGSQPVDQRIAGSQQPMDRTNAGNPQPMDQTYAGPPQPIYPQPQPQPNYQEIQPAYQQPEPSYQQQQRPLCQPRPNCQVGIFPSAGGGCGAKQYGGRVGCDQVDAWRPVVVPQAKASATTHDLVAKGLPPPPSFPRLDERSGSLRCGDISNTCESMPTIRCQNSQLINNVVCPQSCGTCKSRKK